MKKTWSKVLVTLMALVMVLALASCSGCKEPEGPAKYTYNSAMSEFPTNWNPHTYQTATDATILDYTSVGFYAFDYNDAKDGYKIVNELATAEPQDVTSQYVGKYDIKEGDTGLAYVIKLREDIKWDDGTPINAHDFVESAKLLLNPKAVNYRADSLYNGNMVVKNAKLYFYGGRDIKDVNSGDGKTMTYAFDTLVKGEDGYYKTPNGEVAYFGIDASYAWMGGNSLTQYKGYFPEGVYDALYALADAEGYVKINDQAIELLYSFTGSDVWGNESKADLGYYVSFDKHYDEFAWDEVGIFANSDYELTLILEKPLDGFYLLYSLTSTWLVKTDLYKECEKIDADGVYTNSYGTTDKTTPSYGPYKLTSFQMDKQMTFTKNDQWYGHTEGTYQTTDIVIDCVKEAATRLQLFLQGKLDTYGLTKEDMEAYSKSDYTYYQPGESTFFIALNPNFTALETNQKAEGADVNKTILTLKEFRMAMSFGINRSEFCLATSPMNNGAFAIFSELIVSDPDKGETYRATDVAKNVITTFWDLNDSIGEGKLYADADEAIASLTGYNLAKAQELFNEAYDLAIEQKLMDENDKIVIKIGTPNNTSTFYVNGYEFIVNNYTEAVKGTKLEGKLEFKLDSSLGNGFADALRNNSVDMLFGVGWSGSALDPYGLIGAYTEPDYQYNNCWDTSASLLTIKVDGVDYTASVLDWTKSLAGDKITIKDAAGNAKEFSAGSNDDIPETRLAILAALEIAVLERYEMIPVIDDSSASMRGMQIKYYTENYVFGMGRGGIKYYTYNYTDAEWDAFVAEQGGTLKYN